MAIPIRKDRLWWAIGGVSGCVLALWNFWSLYVWFDFLHYTTSKKYMLIILCASVGCICVFLYSLFDGKGERYLRLVAVIALVIIFYWLLKNIYKFYYQPQLARCVTGLFATFICLFYPKPKSGKFVVLVLSSYTVLLFVFTPHMPINHRDNDIADSFFYFNAGYLRHARSYRTYLEKQNQYYDGERDITLDFEKYAFEHEYIKYSDEGFRSMISRGGLSLTVQDGQWYLRVNIPVLLPYYIDFNMPLYQRERVISLIKDNVARQAERGRIQVLYDEDADIYDIFVEAWPEKIER